jgi:uncharacterized repeat protein (TIGR02543 family)
MSQDPKSTRSSESEASRRYGLFGVSAYPSKSAMDPHQKRSMVRWLDAVIVLAAAAVVLLVILGAHSGGLTVSFDCQGGSAAATQSVKYGSLAQEPEDVVRPGYTLEGWSLDPDGGQFWNFETDAVTQGLTLYAVWAAE